MKNVKEVIDQENPVQNLISINTFQWQFDLELGTKVNLEALYLLLQAPQELKETYVKVVVNYMFLENWW